MWSVIWSRASAVGRSRARAERLNWVNWPVSKFTAPTQIVRCCPAAAFSSSTEESSSALRSCSSRPFGSFKEFHQGKESGLRSVKRSPPVTPRNASWSVASSSEPIRANGAMMAPVETPVTTSNVGRAGHWSPLLPLRSVQPFRNPAPYAPHAPPPDKTKTAARPRVCPGCSPHRAVTASSRAASKVSSAAPVTAGHCASLGLCLAHPPSQQIAATHNRFLVSLFT